MKTRNTFSVTSISFEQKGTKIVYDYTYDRTIAKYFNPNETLFVSYNIDVSGAALSIAIIPLLANILPISWFAGFDVVIDELDEKFHNSLEKIKLEFQKTFPELKGVESCLKFNKLIKNQSNSLHKAMLFSGGVDSYATYFRLHHQNIDLITIHGADIQLRDFKQWDSVVYLSENENLLVKNKKHYIRSNLRTFYSYQVDLLLKEMGWWGRVQHGLALNCILAPISTLHNYSKIFIAASYTDKIKIAWGSAPEIDNLIKWANVSVCHDGYELQRQEKVAYIINKTRDLENKVKLRVCYSELNHQVNCSNCEKCYRTILGIILSNANPNDYGFNVDGRIYSSVISMFKKGFKSEGVLYFWWEINETITKNKNFYIFSSNKNEKNEMALLNNLLTFHIQKGVNNKPKLNKIKYTLINIFPKIFKLYLQYRQKRL